MADTPPLPTIYSEAFLAFIRHLLTGLAGILVSRGLIAETQTAELINIGIGAATFALTMWWSWWQKRNAKQVLLTAVAAANSTEQLVAHSAAQAAPSVLTAPSVVPIASGKS
jgi:hypothetical protein